MYEIEDGHSPRRIAGIGFVVLFHIVVIYALVNGLGEQVVQALHQPFEAKIIQDVKPPQAPPPPPPQLVQPPPPYIPLPVVQIAPVDSQRVIATVTQVKPTVPAPVAPPVLHGAALDPNQTCNVDYDGDISKVSSTLYQFLIGPDGGVLSAQIGRSSGDPTLDQFGLNALRQCHWKPAIGADGKPQAQWTETNYDWEPSS